MEAPLNGEGPLPVVRHGSSPVSLATTATQPGTQSVLMYEPSDNDGRVKGHQHVVPHAASAIGSVAALEAAIKPRVEGRLEHPASRTAMPPARSNDTSRCKRTLYRPLAR